MRVLDSGVFIEGRAIRGVTVPGVAEEVEVPPTVPVLRPSDRSLRRVEDAARELGDLDVLSRTDVELLALALDLRGTVVTNDFAVQNVAVHLGLQVEAIEKEIKDRIEWIWYCPACGRTYGRRGECDYCGTALKRRPKSLRRIRGGRD